MGGARLLISLPLLFCGGCEGDSAPTANAAIEISSNESQRSGRLTSDTQSAADDTLLKQVAGTFSSTIISEANRESIADALQDGETEDDAFQFAETGMTIQRYDFDYDGDQDAVVLVEYCEEIRCHPTTQTTAVGLFENRKNEFVLLSSRHTGPQPEIEGWTDTGVNISSATYGEDDPQCCPSKRATLELPFKR